MRTDPPPNTTRTETAPTIYRRRPRGRGLTDSTPTDPTGPYPPSKAGDRERAEHGDDRDRPRRRPGDVVGDLGERFEFGLYVLVRGLAATARGERARRGGSRLTTRHNERRDPPRWIPFLLTAALVDRTGGPGQRPEGRSDLRGNAFVEGKVTDMGRAELGPVGDVGTVQASDTATA